jgi:hypothetical protein
MPCHAVGPVGLLRWERGVEMSKIPTSLGVSLGLSGGLEHAGLA